MNNKKIFNQLRKDCTSIYNDQMALLYACEETIERVNSEKPTFLNPNPLINPVVGSPLKFRPGTFGTGVPQLTEEQISWQKASPIPILPPQRPKPIPQPFLPSKPRAVRFSIGPKGGPVESAQSFLDKCEALVEQEPELPRQFDTGFMRHAGENAPSLDSIEKYRDEQIAKNPKLLNQDGRHIKK